MSIEITKLHQQQQQQHGKLQLVKNSTYNYTALLQNLQYGELHTEG